MLKDLEKLNKNTIWEREGEREIDVYPFGVKFPIWLDKDMMAYTIYYEWNKFDILMGATDVGAACVSIIKKGNIDFVVRFSNGM